MGDDTTESADPDLKLETKWRDRVSQATKYHDTYFGRKIAEIARFERGEQWNEEREADRFLEHAGVNLIWANRRTVIPQIFYSRPDIQLTPLTDRLEYPDPETGEPILHDVVRAAELAKPVIEQKLDQMRWKWQVKEIVRDGWLFGLGWGKIGFGSQYGKLAQAPFPDDGQPHDFDIRAPITGWSQSVHPEQPWFLRVHPKDLILPPEMRSFDEMPWACHKMFRRVEDVKSDSRYDKEARESIGSQPLGESPDRADDFDHDRDRYVEDEFCLINEVHYRDAAQPKKYEMDREFEEGATVYRIITYCDAGKGILLHTLDGIGMDIGHIPFLPLVYATDSDRTYPQSDVGQSLDQQRELNKILSHNLEMVKRQNPPILYDASTFPDPETEEKFLSGEPMRAIKVNSVAGIVVPEMPQISQDQYSMVGTLENNIRKMMGVGEAQQGTSSGGTATEASIVQSNLTVRTQDMLEVTRDFACQSVQDIFVLISQRTKTPEKVRIEGPKGAKWQEWTGKDIRGYYRFKVDITQMQPPNSAVRKKMAIDLLNLSATPAVSPYVNMQKLVHQVFKAFEDVLPNTEELLKETMEPNQDAEILAMLNGEPVQVTPDQHHAEHRQKLARYMQSPSMGVQPPEAQQLLMQHDQMHAMFEQQLYGSGSAGPSGGGSPMEAGGAQPAMMGNKAPTESSLMAGASGGRSPGVA